MPREHLPAMVDQLDRLTRALHRAGVDDEASRRLVELAAIATVQAAMLDAFREEAPNVPSAEAIAAELQAARLAA